MTGTELIDKEVTIIGSYYGHTFPKGSNVRIIDFDEEALDYYATDGENDAWIREEEFEAL